MQCPNCQNTVPDTANVCGYCGTRLRTPAPASMPTPQPVSVSPALPAKSASLHIWLFRVSLIGFAMLGLVIIGLVMLRGNSSQTIIEPHNPGQSLPSNSLVNIVNPSPDTNNQLFTLQFEFDQPGIISLGWCTTTREILDENSRHITYSLTLNGQTVDVSKLYSWKQIESARICQSYVGIIRKWPVGRHTIVITTYLKQAMNDGWFDYPVGEYITRYEISVKQ